MTTKIATTWSDIFSRPSDSHYDNMEKLLDVAEEAMQQSRVEKASSAEITFKFDEDEGLQIVLHGHTAIPVAQFALAQTAGMAKIPVPLLERLNKLSKNQLIVDNLNALFPNDKADKKQILIRDTFDPMGGGLLNSVARAVNGAAYSRLWDFEVFEEAEDQLIPHDFCPKIPQLKNHAMSNGLMWNLQSALFRGDQCSFGFFFSTKESNDKSAALGGLQPGIMVWNSEVGARSFGYHTFYYHEQSGSILVWSPSNQRRKRFVHRGDIRTGFREYMRTLEGVALNYQERYEVDVMSFNLLAMTPFAPDRDQAVERLREQYKMSVPAAKAAVDASFLTCNMFGDDLSVWRIALGIAHEAGQTGRAEALVDDTLVATRVMQRMLGKTLAK